jgi:hypothetical protein
VRLGPLDALSQGGVAKKRRSTGIHGQSLARILPAMAVRWPRPPTRLAARPPNRGR